MSHPSSNENLFSSKVGGEDQETMSEKLHFTPEEMRKMGYQVVDRIVQHICQLPDKPVTRCSSPSHLEKVLGESIPEQGRSFDLIIQQLDEVVFSQIMHLGHPRFFAFVPGPSNYATKT